MTLIKMYFVSVVRKLSSEVADKSVGKVSLLLPCLRCPVRSSRALLAPSQDLSDTALNALLYTKFSNNSEVLRILIFELEKRARSEPAEYGSLLDECYGTWFSSRTGLLSGSLAEEVRRMDPGTTDLIKLVRLVL